MTVRYVYIWEYRVHPARFAQFEAAYGPSGTWVELFRRAEGYLRTELIRDRADRSRYVTIDYWVSRGDWERFRVDFAEEFEKLDAACEDLTEDEKEIGQFDAAGPEQGDSV